MKVVDEGGDVPKRLPAARLRSFRSTVWKYWKENGRHNLPWRKTKNPYRILVSEIMLQQTQVSRAVEKYKEFLKKFPTVGALAKAPLADVLRVWSGMGYNRRAKFLRDAAKIVVEEQGGKVPRDFAALRTLPGVGDYTAHAVRVFAWNEPDVLIETNIRAAFIHHFFSNIPIILDSEILEYAQRAVKGQDSREWHWALMDYGAHIKKLHKNPARKSAQYAKQSKFEGSLRQIRGAVLRFLGVGSENPMRSDLIEFSEKKIGEALKGLERDGLIVEVKGSARARSALGRKWMIA